MTTPTWSSAVAKGRERMETEHRVELSLLDALEDAVKRDVGPNRVDAILEQLLEHTSVHFMSEQLLMRLTAYSNYEAHAEEHERLTDQVRALSRHVAAGHLQLSLEIIESMRYWLLAHMEGKDRALAAYLNGNTKAPPLVS